jgi:hypothetical protein
VERDMPIFAQPFRVRTVIALTTTDGIDAQVDIAPKQTFAPDYSNPERTS